MPARPHLSPAAPLLLLACLAAGPAVPPSAMAAEPVRLFDGTTFTGWHGDTANTWRIEDGAIVAGNADGEAPRNEFLATDRSFGDFELRLEFRLDAAANGNAGVQFRTARIPDHHEVVGYQADIGPGFDGCLYDESRRKRMLVTPPQDVVQRALAAARDGWHDYLIRCTGPRIRLAINGVETVDYTETDPTIPRSGVIALQIHGGMRGTIRYRNIRIVEFPPLLATDFRRPPEDEGWQPSGPPDAFVGDVVRLALDPDEHGVRIVRGTILSPPVPVEPFAYYRVRLLARGEAGGHCAAVFRDAAGAELVADVYDAIDASPDWRPYELCARGLQGAATMRFRLQGNYNRTPAPPLAVKNVRIERIEPAEAAAWAARLAAACPVVRFTPAADRWEFLPETRRRLAAGERLRIVMLGDSICNDTSNSLFETLLAAGYPRARIEVVTSVRGGTGCVYYKDEGRVRPYVLDHAPDLVIIAGISHDFDVGAIRDVIRQIRAGSACELLVMSGAIAPRSVIEPAFVARTPAAVALDRMERFPEDLARMCREERVQYLDMRRAWDDYMLESYEPFGHFARDAIHANSRGKAVLGRILGRVFAPQPDARRP